MMGFKGSITRISIIILLVSVSCSSVKGVKRLSNEAVMYGMVYNDESIPVSNVEVIVDGVIHLVMMNAVQLINRAELAMDEGRYPDVIVFCDRALALNSERIDASYLKALSLIRLREYGSARTILEALQKQTGGREYIQQVLERLPE